MCKCRIQLDRSASHQDPGVARKTEEFLTDQSAVLKIQAQHLKEEHELRLRYLSGQVGESAIRRFGARIRASIQLAAAALMILAASGVVALVYEAFHSRNVVVEPFQAPPSAAARGLTGEVVASRVLDELTRLQAANHAHIYERGAKSAWAGEVKLAVSETGFSLSEFSRLLKARLGNDTHIDGDLVEREGGGLALTVRGDGVLPKMFTGGAGDFDRLAAQAAEYVYAEALPGTYAYYLVNVSRFDDAIAFARQKLPSTADGVARAWLLTSWAIALGTKTSFSNPEVESLYRASLRADPQFWWAYNNISVVQEQRGDEEAAWRTEEDFRVAAGGRPGRAPPIAHAGWYGLTQDNAELLRLIDDDRAVNGSGVWSDSSAAGIMIARIQADLHDPAAAVRALRTLSPDQHHDTFLGALPHIIRGTLAIDVGDKESAASEYSAIGSMARASPIVADLISQGQPEWLCSLARVAEAAGKPAEADSLLQSGRFVDCYRYSGDVLDGRNDWAGAQQAYANAVTRAPDLPAGYFSWGAALARHGDLGGAIAKLKAANQRGPHWADPLKTWGDLLVKQGHPQEALAKYDEALKYAPNWKQLKEARDAVAKQRS
jgi:tetratricopeptide (TPR) repeat protein